MVSCERKRSTAFGLAVGVLIAAMSCAAAHADSGLVPRAESALRQKLSAAYPGVERWQISLLPQQWQRSVGLERASGHHAQIFVTRVGSQSAVWVGASPADDGSQGALLWFRVEGYGQALVATHLIPSGAGLHAADAEPAERDIVAAACRPVTNLARLAGMRASRLILAGGVICAGALEPMPPVVQGEEVTARFASRGVVVTARVRAESDGFQGGPVTVRSDSGDIFTATVTGKGEVSVSE